MYLLFGTMQEQKQQRQDSAPRAAQLALDIVADLAQLLFSTAQYLYGITLDLIYASRKGFLLRARNKLPERAREFDAKLTRLREERSKRWSSWLALPGGRRLEIRAAAALMVVAAVLGLHVYLNRRANPTEQVVSPAAKDSARVDGLDFLAQCQAAAPGQVITYGTQSVDAVRARIAQAKARWESARADSQAAYNFYNKQLSRESATHDAAAVAAAKEAFRAAERKGNDEYARYMEAQRRLGQAGRPEIKPVLQRGELNEWDDFKVMSPVVMKEGSRYRMWYVGCHFIGDEYTCGVGHAQSRDGVLWEKSPAPVLVVDDPDTSQYLNSITIVRSGDRYLMWYAFDSSLGHDCTILDLATSPDGLSWQPEGTVLRANCKSYAHLWPSAFYDGKTLHLWYADYDSSASGFLMHATSTNGKDWISAGSTSIATLGIDPRRIWVLPDRAGAYSALFVAPKWHFGMLRSADLKTWQASDRAPKLPKTLDQVELESPAAIGEPSALWVWVGVPSNNDGAITLAVQKEGTQ